MAMVGLLISLSLISAQKRETESIAGRNAKNERIAREAVDRLGAQMAERLAEIPAASGVRRQLLEETLIYYQQYAANAQNSPDLRRSLALTMGKIGELHGELGNTELAIAALRDSESAFHALVGGNTSDAKALSEWATSLNNLGQALHRQGDWPAATTLIEQAIELQSSLSMSSDADDAKIQLATSWSNLGLLLADQAEAAKAELAYRKSIELLEHVTDSTIDVTIQLATVKTNLSGLLSKSRPADAIKLAQQALKSEADALERQPNNVRLSKQTALTLAAMATAQADDKQYFAASATYKQAVDIGQQLVTRWPDQPQYRVDLATHLNQLGVVYSRMNRAMEAHDIFIQALDHQRKLAAQFPNDAEVISTTGSLLNNVGFLCLQLQQRDQAVEAFEEAVKFQAEAVRLAPKTSRYAEYLQKHQTNLRSAQSKRK
jgi:tetratricopeptide (TPR) repeat protein